MPGGGASHQATAGDADVWSALERSHLAKLPRRTCVDLLAGSVRARVPPGTVTHREGDTTPHLELVISGVHRVFVTAPDGRTMTVRYCRPGALLGAVSIFSPGFVMPATVQALVPVEVLRVSPSVARRMAGNDVRVAHALLEELSERVLSFLYEIPGSAFTSVRQRVARHLLDLASECSSGGGSEHALVAVVSQRELAEAVGTVREVVVRTLRELRRDGVVRTEKDRIVIVDPVRLVQGPNGTQVPDSLRPRRSHSAHGHQHGGRAAPHPPG